MMNVLKVRCMILLLMNLTPDIENCKYSDFEEICVLRSIMNNTTGAVRYAAEVCLKEVANNNIYCYFDYEEDDD